jgi:rubrerythrin
MELSYRIQGCIAIEEAAASLYNSFMKLLPEEKDFWESILNDEIDHSSFLKDAAALDMFQKLPLQAQPPSIPFIEKTLEFVQSVNTRIMSNPVTFEDALTIALQFEESMVETYTNELLADIQSDDDKSYFMNVKKMLTEERGHVSKIKNKMIKKGFLKFS